MTALGSLRMAATRLRGAAAHLGADAAVARALSTAADLAWGPGGRRLSADRVVRRVLGALGVAPPPPVPTTVNWQLTYACPLRCEHCYSESGRRPAKQLSQEELLRVADTLLAIRPLPGFAFSGGEPTLVPGFVELARKIRGAGASVKLYTGGYKLRPALVEDIARTFSAVAVSVDGADATVNDHVRGRQGSFDEALATLARLDALAADRATYPARFGVEFSVVRSNWDQLEAFCRDVVPRFPRISFVHFGAVVPAGLASRRSFVEAELLGAEQMASLGERERALAALLPAHVEVRLYSNLGFMMHPDQIRHGRSCDIILEIEADGGVRAMSMYEGVVGNLLTDPFDVIWRRTIERQRDPRVVGALRRIRSMEDWGTVARELDERFASDAGRARLAARSPLGPSEQAPVADAGSRRRALRVLWP